eukprot:CAMPEP_0180674900 /NCGR_PEP_ID=MMETSP1037_2-20121125/66476_1 /TAXON_ID=632150 /ORGANISM="Azadinium spinosum, Strain 3D9" /LENGTH=120 /DNA_ID=CAMNT_0022704269 /DNA_START=50 /DNA_END=412 /DNA_ORIENTATION=+
MSHATVRGRLRPLPLRSRATILQWHQKIAGAWGFMRCLLIFAAMRTATSFSVAEQLCHAFAAPTVPVQFTGDGTAFMGPMKSFGPGSPPPTFKILGPRSGSIITSISSPPTSTFTDSTPS